MAFRQSAPLPLSRQYSSPSQQVANNDVLLSPTRTQQARFEPQLGPISDFGSLNTVPQSEEEELSDIIEDVADDLDSLDDKLQEFRDISAYKTSDFQNGAILPAHDGMGSFYPAKAQFGPDSILETAERGAPRFNFGINQTSTLDSLQNQQWDEDGLERSRHDRIEQWRLEQSKIVLEEIDKQRQKTEAQHSQENQSMIDEVSSQKDKLDHQIFEEGGSESIWQQLARHVMRDLIGVNDTVLSAIFGEDLMPEEELSKTPTPNTRILPSSVFTEAEETGILSNLIKELRRLAQGLSSDTPVTKEQLAGQLDYAGIPVSWLEDRITKPTPVDVSASAQFKPTLTSSQLPQSPIQPETLTTEAEYWEQTPNLKTVISYLYRRFRSSVSTTNQDKTTSIPKTQEALHRAAIIQQYHPLTSRTHHPHPYHPRNKKHHRQHSTSQKAVSITSGIPHSWNLKRRGSSCASWSTKRSRRGESNASRNYWDLGESTGSGSLVFAGIGAWGEV